MFEGLLIQTWSDEAWVEQHAARIGRKGGLAHWCRSSALTSCYKAEGLHVPGDPVALPYLIIEDCKFGRFELCLLRTL